MRPREGPPRPVALSERRNSAKGAGKEPPAGLGGHRRSPPNNVPPSLPPKVRASARSSRVSISGHVGQRDEESYEALHLRARAAPSRRAQPYAPAQRWPESPEARKPPLTVRAPGREVRRAARGRRSSAPRAPDRGRRRRARWAPRRKKRGVRPPVSKEACRPAHHWSPTPPPAGRKVTNQPPPRIALGNEPAGETRSTTNRITPITRSRIWAGGRQGWSRRGAEGLRPSRYVWRHGDGRGDRANPPAPRRNQISIAAQHRPKCCPTADEDPDPDEKVERRGWEVPGVSCRRA